MVVFNKKCVVSFVQKKMFVIAKTMFVSEAEAVRRATSFLEESQYATMVGIYRMQMLFVDNWDFKKLNFIQQGQGIEQ